MFEPRTILLPTDFSAHAEYSLEVARGLARAFGARLILLHVVPPTPLVGRDQTLRAFKEAHAVEDLAAYRAEMKERLTHEAARATDVDASSLMLEGNVGDAIMHAAETHDVDLIVMGSRGMTNAKGLAMGSVAWLVAERARCPVIAVSVPPTVVREEGTCATLAASR